MTYSGKLSQSSDVSVDEEYIFGKYVHMYFRFAAISDVGVSIMKKEEGKLIYSGD